MCMLLVVLGNFATLIGWRMYQKSMHIREMSQTSEVNKMVLPLFAAHGSHEQDKSCCNTPGPGNIYELECRSDCDWLKWIDKPELSVVVAVPNCIRNNDGVQP